MELKEFWAKHPAAAVALSGGVDSAALLCSAVEAGAQVGAYFVKTELQPAAALADAQAAAEALGVSLQVVALSALAEETVAANGPERCYHCKKRLFSAILTRARADGFPLLLDGTNAGDDEKDRPGMRALAELGVLSPLRLCGVGKKEARAMARAAGLALWDKPACACLATRFPRGTPLTAEGLAAVEAAEEALYSMGFSDLRLRLVPGGAKLQLPAAQLPRAAALHGRICEALAPRFGDVTLDLTPRGGEEEETPLDRDRVCELRCNVDDMTGEEAAFALERLLEAGALDAWTQAIIGKKGRPALLFGCLCRPEDGEAMSALLLRHTTTLGVRRSEAARTVLVRSERRCGPVRVKTASGGGIRREKPEFEDLAALARAEGLSLREAREKYGLIPL